MTKVKEGETQRKRVGHIPSDDKLHSWHNRYKVPHKIPPFGLLGSFLYPPCSVMQPGLSVRSTDRFV